jgi:hypothetical protein
MIVATVIGTVDAGYLSTSAISAMATPTVTPRRWLFPDESR